MSTRYHATFCDRRPWLYRAAVHAIRPNPCWLRRRGRAWPLPRSAVGGFERSSQVFTQYFEPFRADHTFTLVVLIVLWHRGPGVELAAISRGRLVPTLGYEPGCGVLYSPGGRWKRVICTRPQRCVPLYPSSAWRNVGVVSPRPAHGPARTREPLRGWLPNRGSRPRTRPWRGLLCAGRQRHGGLRQPPARCCFLYGLIDAKAADLKVPHSLAQLAMYIDVRCCKRSACTYCRDLVCAQRYRTST